MVTAEKPRPSSLRFAVLQIAGLRINASDGHDVALEQLVPLAMCREELVVKRRREGSGKDWRWRAGQTLLSVAVLTQAVGTAFLVIHRAEAMEDSPIYLDIWSAGAAICGAVCATLSILPILAVPKNHTWTYARTAARTTTSDPTTHVLLQKSLVLPLVFSLAITSIMLHLGNVSPGTPFATALWLFFLPELFWGNTAAEHERRSSLGASTMLMFFPVNLTRRGSVAFASVMAMLMESMNQWVFGIWLLVDAAFVGSPGGPANWAWSDPLSDQLFVY